MIHSSGQLTITWVIRTTTAGRKNRIQWTLCTQLRGLEPDAHSNHTTSHTQMEENTNTGSYKGKTEIMRMDENTTTLAATRGRLKS